MYSPQYGERTIGMQQSANELAVLLRQDEVARRLATLMRISCDHGIESAFAIYDDGNVSDVTHPPLDGVSHRSPWGGLQIDMSPINGSTQSDSLRAKLRLHAHTHPPTTPDAKAKPYPSSSDLSYFNALSRQKETIIHGVLSWSPHTPVRSPQFSLRGLRTVLGPGSDRHATLFLMRHNPDEYRRVYEDRWSMTPGYYPERETWEAFTRSADARGINYAQVPVHPRTGRILDDSQLPQLFYAGATEVPRDQRSV
jgi:hypothetical protein